MIKRISFFVALFCVILTACSSQPSVRVVKSILPAFLNPLLVGRSYAPTLGEVIEKGMNAYTIRPSDPHLSKIVLSVDPVTGKPLNMEIVFANDSLPIVKDVKRWLGEDRAVPRMHPEDPDRVIFYYEKGDGPYAAAVIADLEPDGAKISAITIRRDKREQPSS